MTSETQTLELDGRRIQIAAHNCFACGTLNRDGLRLDLHLGTGRAWTDVVIDDRLEGWDGIAHGGILCTILDEVMAWALVERDAWGVTARMTVTFKAPVVVGTKVHGEGRLVESSRRVFRTAAALTDAAGTLLATAEGTYVAAPEERKRALRSRYAFRELVS